MNQPSAKARYIVKSMMVVMLATLSVGCSQSGQSAQSASSRLPSIDDVKPIILDWINEDDESKGRIELVEVHKTNGLASEVFGVEEYELEFEGEIEFTENCKWLIGGVMGFGFKIVTNVTEEREYGINLPGVQVRKGQREKFKGIAQFEKTENGWGALNVELSNDNTGSRKLLR